MKRIFVKDGVVVSLGAGLAAGVDITCSVQGAVTLDVENSVVVDVGWRHEEHDGTAVFSPPLDVLQKVSPVQFKLLFTVLERVAIKTSDDPIVKDFFEIVNDPRLTFVDLALESTQQALAYLESKSLIGKGRPAQILTGIIQ